MTNVLIVEDEPRIAAFVAKGLGAAGYAWTTEPSGVAAAALAASGDYDLVLLDIGLPDIDGFEVLRRIRRGASSVPVIMLTARTSARDTVAGLQGGADDYVPKPFDFEELLARIRLRLRDVRQPDAMVLRHRGLELDLLSHRASVDGAEVTLSAREFTLAETFLRHPGQVLSRQQLLNAVWGYDFDPGSNIVDVYVRYLRRKLGPGYLETVRGVGYRLE